MKKRLMSKKEKYTHWKFRNKAKLDSIYTVLVAYSILLLFAILASADAICNRWMPFCIGWFD
jgi:hypothetical protein